MEKEKSESIRRRINAEQISACTVGEWVEVWFYTHAEGRTKPNTEGGYRNLIFSHISPGLSGVVLDNLTARRVQAFYASLLKKGLSNRSVWCVHLLLRRILDEACREQHIRSLLQQGAADKIGGFMAGATAPTPGPPEPTTPAPEPKPEGGCKIIPFARAI